MPRARRIRVVGLNIATSPHSPEIYLGLFQRARNAKIAGLMHGNRWGRIGSIASNPDANGLHFGRLNTFVDFDLKKPWLNTDTDDIAGIEQVRAIQLPANLKPEYLPIEFAFHPGKHLLFIRAEKTGPTNLERVIFNLLNHPRVNRGEQRVNVTVVQEESALDRIFGIETLSRLRIVVSRPNPDDFEEFDARLKERLAEQSADQVTVELVGTDGLEPDETTKALAYVALKNGSVLGSGKRADGLKVTESSLAHPRVIDEMWDPKKKETETDVFVRAIRKWPARVAAKILR
ncbi:MAG TPA: DUF4747 family protein [Polyangiaceae bacterium]|nr:DUF4747 family protein [Polyangiaceae bacterium]